MTELKPCPFCGEMPEWHQDLYDNTFCLYCNNEKCTADMVATDHYANKEDAIKAWNNRHSLWHTGTPTDDGLYSVYYLDDHNPSATPYEVLYDGFLSPDGEGNWIDRDGERRFIDDDIVRWQKIELYKEK